MNILDKIIARKKEEVADRKATVDEMRLSETPAFEREPYSLTEALRARHMEGMAAIIAEFKQKSPSKGVIHAEADVQQTTTGYVDAGAAALSVLTDIDFFGGSDEKLKIARRTNRCPILRKDFTIDTYQITEAKALGADAILLIAAVLQPDEVQRLAAYAGALGLEVLLEVHNAEELQRTALDQEIAPYIHVVGVNNRDLRTFDVSIQTSIKLAEQIPPDMVKISESGISDPQSIRTLMDHGYQGFLIGETFMKEADPAAACRAFIRRIYE
jgi:indole-3-glycerol phosphate synthase